MAKSPADRYQTADEMRADIERAASGLPVAAATADPGGHVPGHPADGRRPDVHGPDGCSPPPTIKRRGCRTNRAYRVFGLSRIERFST